MGIKSASLLTNVANRVLARACELRLPDASDA